MHILSRIIVGICLILSVQIPAAHATFPFHLYKDFTPQNGVGGIAGKIMGNLEIVSGADVELMQKDKLIDKTQTDENGHYAFLYLRPGDYDVKVTKADYRTHIIITIPVTGDNTTQNDIYLPKFNNTNMPKNPIVETYEENYHKYIRHK